MLALPSSNTVWHHYNQHSLLTTNYFNTKPVDRLYCRQNKGMQSIWLLAWAVWNVCYMHKLLSEARYV